MRRFGGDMAIWAGARIELGGEPHEVIGIPALGSYRIPRREILAAAQGGRVQPRPHELREGRSAPPAPRHRSLRARRQANARDNAIPQLYPFALGPWEELSAEPLSDVVVGDIRPSLGLLTGSAWFRAVHRLRKRRQPAAARGDTAGGGRLPRGRRSEPDAAACFDSC